MQDDNKKVEIIKKMEKLNDNVPCELKDQNRWCLYKIVLRNQKYTKIPLMPNGEPAKSNDESTWRSYNDCLAALNRNIGDGLGFFLGGGYIGIDIDKVGDDMNAYSLDREAHSMSADFLRNISTYAEVSPSKKGIHFIGKGKVPGDRKRHKNLEIYDEGRFFTVTGDVIKDKDRSEILNIDSALAFLYKKYMPITVSENPKKTIGRYEKRLHERNPVDTGDVLDLLFDRGYFNYTGDDLRQIYSGNYENYFSSQSEADFFMLQRLIYYTSDTEMAISIMERSGLKRNKWKKRRGNVDYIHYIGQKAMNGMRHFYEWDRSAYVRKDMSKNKIEKEDKMPRYEYGDLNKSLRSLQEEIKNDTKIYESYLKVVGNNHKYPYFQQLSIYNINPEATACAEYGYWKTIGRSVKGGEKGIPILDLDTGKVKYIFDVTQTVSRGHGIAELRLWKYKGEKHLKALDILIDNFKERDSNLIFGVEDKINAMVSLYTKRVFNKVVDGLKEETLKENKKIQILKFIEESTKVSVYERLGIDFNSDEEKLRLISKVSNKQDLDILFFYTSNNAKTILTDVGREISKIEEKEILSEIHKKEQTRADEERYNKLNKDETGKTEKLNIDFKGGLKDERNSSISEQRVSSGEHDLHTDGERESLRKAGRDVQIGEDGRWRGDFSSDSKHARVGGYDKTKSVWESKADLSQGGERSRISDDANGRNLDGTSIENRGAGRGLFGDRGTENERSLGNDTSDAGSRLSEIRRSEKELGYDIDTDGNGTNHLGIDDDKIEESEEEVDLTSFSFGENKNNQLGLRFPHRQEEIDSILIYGGNVDRLRLKVISEYSKGKSIEELADFLKSSFRGGNGYKINGQSVSSWYHKDGIYLSSYSSAKYNPDQIISWKDAAKRIEELLNKGKYASNIELVESMSNERKELSEKLWYFRHDFSDDVKGKYLPALYNISKAGFPDETEEMAENLKSPEFRQLIREEYAKFKQDYNENPNILRFHYHNIENIGVRIDDLEIDRKEFHSDIIELPTIEAFITEDEMNENFIDGSGVSGGKDRIYNFYQKESTLKEKVDFLKAEYGVGGRSPALSGATGSEEWHDSKGVTLKKRGCPTVFFNWNQVANKIKGLIDNNKYLDEQKNNKDKGEKEQSPPMVAVKVGEYYAIVEQKTLDNVKIERTGANVYPQKDNSKGKIYPLYRGVNFEESQKIDKIFDEILETVKVEEIENLNDEIYLANKRISPTKRDIVTYFKEGYDFEVKSLGKQFPDYSNDLYVVNKNLKIDGENQNIAYIDRNGNVNFHVNLSEEDKTRIMEIKDKKLLLSTLIFKEIKDLGEYHFDSMSEEFLLTNDTIAEERLKKPDKELEPIDGEKGYKCELVLDMKNKELKNKLMYNGYLLKTQTSVKYDSYKEMLENLGYLLDDNHRETLLRGFIEEEISLSHENSSQIDSQYKEGMKVRYQGKEYLISEIMDYDSYKTIKLSDSETYFNGFVSGSEIIPFRKYEDLKLEVLHEDNQKEPENINRNLKQLNFDDLSQTNELSQQNSSNKDKESFSDVVGETEIAYEDKDILTQFAQEKDDSEIPVKSADSSNISLSNYKITQDTEILTPSERLKNNIEAIKVLKDIERRNYPATKEEKDILNKFVGWGGLSEVFDDNKTGNGQWQQARSFLKENLSTSEYEEARESTLTAFYTPKTVVDGIYNILDKLGFKGGNILEKISGKMIQSTNTAPCSQIL